MTKRSTSTSAFGVSKRESHDASGFYRRFTPPALSPGSEVASHRSLDKLVAGDARRMDEVPDASVALVVTSPPYFAGKEYEESLGEGGAPATYLEYLELLRNVFAQCAQKLEPGGRIAVNVANLGRRPYRSLSADVVGILQDDLRLLLRGEIIWVKQRGSSGSCAWGSFQRPGNPVLRDLTERVIVASKGRFDRAVPAKVRAGRGLPSESSMTREDFMENTLDVWEIPAESATRVGHPAPFPIELPARLIELYTYRGDLVLDPFLGSGTTAVAAVRAGRHFAGYDLDASYVQLAEGRVEEERQRLSRESMGAPVKVALPAVPAPAAADDNFQSRAVREGWAAKEIARAVIEAAGFTGIQKDQHQPGGVEVNFTARDGRGELWLFDVTGSFTSHRAGLKRNDTLWKALGKAAVLREVTSAPLVLLTTGAPMRGSAGAEALRQVTGPNKPVHAVIEMLERSGLDNLRALCEGSDQRAI
ncbi:MAG TPA: site-specific DNA-methyltransferase [Acidimicrobiales bacterium]|nr:site-specific DNA-methyltransferase [Acidimicrobiales bacterium]